MSTRIRVIKPDDRVNQKWSIADIAKEYPPASWERVFEEAAPELHDVSEILKEQEKLYGHFFPLKADLFAAFRTRLQDVKCVIIGQDPYPQSITLNGISMPRATGLAFSVRKGDSIPSSLQNIYSELAASVKDFIKPTHGNLDEWAMRGVLLLNMSLTVRPGVPGSHGVIWHGFVNRVLKAIAAVNPHCVFMLWGKEAQTIKTMIGERSIILEAAHPSGLSARKGFFGCNHFNLCNDALMRQRKPPIDWRITNDTKAITTPMNVHRHADTSSFVPVSIEHISNLMMSKSSVPEPKPLIFTGSSATVGTTQVPMVPSPMIKWGPQLTFPVPTVPIMPLMPSMEGSTTARDPSPHFMNIMAK
jgi:uracil-DNA glycosylase